MKTSCFHKLLFLFFFKNSLLMYLCNFTLLPSSLKQQYKHVLPGYSKVYIKMTGSISCSRFQDLKQVCILVALQSKLKPRHSLCIIQNHSPVLSVLLKTSGFFWFYRVIQRNRDFKGKSDLPSLLGKCLDSY